MNPAPRILHVLARYPQLELVAGKAYADPEGIARPQRRDELQRFDLFDAERDLR